ncbi:hypothetical protein M446_3053 [Methylobacterium sp. 4-46]|uniref:hypothetical protein n=1 Tax=unclassified Methylobacterium TaxID=2615210 RepID=UPI000152E04F|nr:MULTISPECIES: hypothetical protein [Methylobacterium]ACA17464.1 hypothetical protein M446_3053 [Methylobacterium sp. 4-46]WFT83149.1 hypothetical protein QA634_15490 [Methylobacterium nodulans]
MIRRFTAVASARNERAADELLPALARLAAHRGCDRSLLVSAVLGRLLAPAGPFGAPPGLAVLRDRLAALRADAKLVEYLRTNIAFETDAAHRRSVDGD